MNKINKKGFTLVELIAVIVVLALVIVIAATKGFGAFDTAKNKITSMNKDAIEEAIEIIKLDIEHCDDSNTDLLNMFEVDDCGDLYTKLESGADVSLDKMIEKEYITGAGIEEIKKEEIYDVTFTKEGEEITATVKNEEKKAVLLKRNYSTSTEKYFAYKDSIVEVYFVNYVDIEGKTNWDVTDDTVSNTDVYAWLENTSDGNYKLYFGSDGKIYAPEDFSYFFRGFSKVKSISFGNLDTSEATKMEWMFAECSNLQSLDLSSFVTSNVTTMYTMFYKCSSLIELNVSSFETKSVTNMSWMFSGCSSLTKLDISNFKTTESIVEMKYMFRSCSNLTYLDLSGFVTTSSTLTTGMLNFTSKLSTICVDQDKSNEIYSIALGKSITIACS